MHKRRWAGGFCLFTVLCVLLLSISSVSAQQGESPERFMVPDELVGHLPAGSEVLHEYHGSMLVRLADDALSPAQRGRISQLEDTGFLSYRAWRGSLRGHEIEALAGLDEAYFLLALIGPLDAEWRERIESFDLTVVDHANPYGLLVHGSSDAVRAAAADIRTSRGYAVITHALQRPRASRVSPDLAGWLSGRSTAGDLGLLTRGGQPVVRVVFHADTSHERADPEVSRFLAADPEFAPKKRSAQYLASSQSLSVLLDEVPGVAYVHGAYPKTPFNNIGVQEHITNIEPVWTDLSYTGAGLIAGVNDGGLDLEHPDFPPDSVVATSGAMSGTDNGHGTHVTGTVAGRGATPSPKNTFACGDQTEPLPDARGVAWEARVTHNNIFDGGITEEGAMMTWQLDQGAVVNNNSWGYTSIFGSPVTEYGSETVAVDAAVRDADPSSAAINEQLSIVFAAGNAGSAGISKPGNGKNVITVGASQNDRCGSYIPDQCDGPDINGMACFSSHGPSHGRNKPDIVAPGTDVLSTGSTDSEATWGGWDQPWTGDFYATVPGTSMASPVVTGAATLFYQAYMDRHGEMPSPALVKAALINTATDMGAGFPSNIQGWGRLNLRKAIEGPVEDGIAYFDQDDVDHLATGEGWTTQVGVSSGEEPLRVSLVWTDPPGSAGCDPCHINDLDLIVTAPDGTVYRGNQFSGSWSQPDPGGRDEGNNVENVYIQSPMSGEWSVEISAVNVAQNPNLLDGQDFALVSTGRFGGMSVEPAAADVCTADGSTDFMITLTNQFEGTTNLDAAGLPAGTSGTFSTDPVVFPDDQSVFTLNDLGFAAAGDYILVFTATDADDASITAENDASLTVFEGVSGQAGLVTPADAGTALPLLPEFSWNALSAADEYQIQIATDSGFGNIVIDEALTGQSFTPDAELTSGTDYFWRVRGLNACGDGAWSETFTFQTLFEPVHEITPDGFEMTVATGESVNDTLSIGNVGTGDLVWEIGTDAPDTTDASPRSHDPTLDESFDLGQFTLEGDADSPPPVSFSIDAGQTTRGEVVGFSFTGTASGVTGESSWASDTCMVLEAPDGTIFGVGGFSNSGIITGCDGENDWDFQGGDSGDDGTYESVHDEVFDPPLTDQGEWTITFINEWVSDSAADITWSDVTVTLHKQQLPVCTENVTMVPWLSVDSDSGDSGSTPAGQVDNVTVTADSSSLALGNHLGYLCVSTNDTSDANPDEVAIPVELTVFDPDAAANLSLTMVSVPDFVPAGETVNLQVMLTNLGPSAVDDAGIVSAFDETALEDISWSCSAENGGACGTSSGTGQIDELVELPVDGSVFYSVEATLADAGSDEISVNEISATPPAGVPDPDPASAQAQIIIRSGVFADGFESIPLRAIISIPAEKL